MLVEYLMHSLCDELRDAVDIVTLCLTACFNSIKAVFSKYNNLKISLSTL